MTQLDFSLPESPRRPAGRALPWIAFSLALAALAVALALAVTLAGSPPSRSSEEARITGDPETLRKVAEDLERRTLYLQAAEAWEDYANATDLAPAEGARVLYRRARNLREAGRYAEAARLLTHYEHLDVPRDDRRRAVTLLGECLSALGKEEARSNVLSAYAIPRMEEEGTVVARVGGDPITRDEVRDEIERQARALLEAQGNLSPEEVEARAAEVARRRFADPEARLRTLQHLVQTEVLYREGLSRKYASSEEFEEALERFRREYIASRVIRESAREAIAAIDPIDLRNHYDAHEEDYAEKPAVEFSYQEFSTEAEARAALDDLVASDFRRGEGAAAAGEPIPGLGRSAEATAHLLALEEGETGDRPVRIGESWYIFRSDTRRPARQRPFEEVEAEVRADLARIKRTEAIRKLQENLARKFLVEVDEEALSGDASGGGAPAETGRDAAGEGDEPGGARRGEAPANEEEKE